MALVSWNSWFRRLPTKQVLGTTWGTIRGTYQSAKQDQSTLEIVSPGNAHWAAELPAVSQRGDLRGDASEAKESTHLCFVVCLFLRGKPGVGVGGVGWGVWLMAGRWWFYSPTAESFAASAQTGSGVVLGSPEVRFHQASNRLPPGCHQGATRVPSGFHEVLRGLRGCEH